MKICLSAVLIAASLLAPATAGAKSKPHHGPSLMCQRPQLKQRNAMKALRLAIGGRGDVQWAQLQHPWANRDVRRYCR